MIRRPRTFFEKKVPGPPKNFNKGLAEKSFYFDEKMLFCKFN
jgi:hypothetical protein